MLSESNHIIQEFSTSVVGIGALFFAYASVNAQDGFVKLVIASIGLGASIIIWMHAYSSHKNEEAIKEIMMSSNSSLLQKYEKALEWRNGTWYDRYLQQPITRLVTYFSALVALAWILIIVQDAFPSVTGNIPTYPLVALAGLGIAIVMSVLILRKSQDMIRRHKRSAPTDHNQDSTSKASES